MPSKGHRKDPEKKKDRHLRLRLTQAQYELLQQAAGLDELTLSRWAREQLVRIAKVRTGIDEE